MSAVVCDTHALLWYLLEPAMLSAPAAGAFRTATSGGDAIIVPSISLVEVTYLVERRRVPPHAPKLIREGLSDPTSSFDLAPLTFAVANAVEQISRDLVPDMPDRIIAATALALGLPLVTRDARIRSTAIPTIW